jgi:hypothetical protein
MKEKNLKILESLSNKDTIQLCIKLLQYPNSKVCKHKTVLDILSYLEDSGYKISSELANAISNANDEKSIELLSKLIKESNFMKQSKLKRIIKEEVRNALKEYSDIVKSFGKVSTKQDLGVKQYADKVEPELKRRIEGIRAILGQMQQGSKDWKIVKDILDKAESEMKMPTDKQMDLISYIYTKNLKEAGAGLSGMETTFATNKPTDFTFPAPNDEKNDKYNWKRN